MTCTAGPNRNDRQTYEARGERTRGSKKFNGAGDKFATGVLVASVLALALCGTARADNGQDQRFLAALTSAGWSITNASVLIHQAHEVCVEGLAHGVSWQEMRSALMGYGYSLSESSTLIAQAVSVYCPNRKSAIADMNS